MAGMEAGREGDRLEFAGELELVVGALGVFERCVNKEGAGKLPSCWRSPKSRWCSGHGLWRVGAGGSN